MFCEYCGTSMPNDASFCPVCGKQCRAPAPSSAGICCPGCGRAAGTDDDFCFYCGASLRNPPKRPQTAQPQYGNPPAAPYPPNYAAAPPKKKNRGCLIASIIAMVLVAAILISVFAFSRFLDNYSADSADGVRRYEVTLPASDGARAVVEQQAAVAVEAYLVARAYLDKLEHYDLDSFDPDEYLELMRRAATAFEVADALCGAFEENAELLAELADEGIYGADAATYRELASAAHSGGPVFTTAYADDRNEAREWAEDIQRMYDAVPPSKALQVLAHSLKTDTEHASLMFQQAQAIIKGDAEAEADYYNAAYITAVETKAVATTAGFVVAVAATGGTAAPLATAIGTGGIVCNGVNAVLDIGTAVTIKTTNGEGNEWTTFFEKTSADFAPVSGLFALAGAGVNSYNIYKGVDVYDNKVQGMIFIANTVTEYLTGGTILGCNVSAGESGTKLTVSAAEVANEETTKNLLTGLGIPAEIIGEAVSIADGEKPLPEEPDGLGEAADQYIEQWDIFTDPDEPFDVEGYNGYMRESFDTAAEEQRRAAAAGPQLNPETDWLEDDVEETAVTATPAPKPTATPEPADTPALEGGYEEGVAGKYYMICDGIEGERHVESYAYVTLYDSGRMEIICNDDNDFIVGTYDPQKHTFVGHGESDHDWLTATVFDSGTTTLVFNTEASPVTASGRVEAVLVIGTDWVEDMTMYITMEKTD